MDTTELEIDEIDEEYLKEVSIDISKRFNIDPDLVLPFLIKVFGRGVEYGVSYSVEGRF